MLIHYVSGSRADFGLMERSLKRINQAPGHQVGIVVTGQHLVEKYGKTVQDIHASGLPIAGEIPVRLTGDSGAEMGHALADELAGFLTLWEKNRPDLILLLGDRGEMVAGALAAVHLGIHVAHLHGGERTGTLDESFRHVITKLAHLHFPATEEAAERLRRMGEASDTIHVIGAPGLVGVAGRPVPDATALRSRLGLTDAMPLALCVFHPVVQEAGQAAGQVRAVVEATRAEGYAMAILRPNSDAGGDGIDAYLDSIAQGSDFRVLTHLERESYLDLMAISDLMIGNSSSGIIESASFAVPCVNIGSRQNDRQRNTNTADCANITTAAITEAIRTAKNWPRRRGNVYGDGTTDARLLAVLDTLHLTPAMLSKRLMY